MVTEFCINEKTRLLEEEQEQLYKDMIEHAEKKDLLLLQNDLFKTEKNKGMLIALKYVIEND
jgi:hypothetical protein